MYVKVPDYYCNSAFLKLYFFIYFYSLKPNQNLRINILSELPHAYLVYAVIARGRILQHARIDFKGQEQTTNFDLKIEYAMAPNCRLIVYTITDNGKVQYAEAIINVKPSFEHEVCTLRSKRTTIAVRHV